LTVIIKFGRRQVSFFPVLKFVCNVAIYLECEVLYFILMGIFQIATCSLKPTKSTCEQLSFVDWAFCIAEHIIKMWDLLLFRNIIIKHMKQSQHEITKEYCKRFLITLPKLLSRNIRRWFVFYSKYIQHNIRMSQGSEKLIIRPYFSCKSV